MRQNFCYIFYHEAFPALCMSTLEADSRFTTNVSGRFSNFVRVMYVILVLALAVGASLSSSLFSEPREMGHAFRSSPRDNNDEYRTKLNITFALSLPRHHCH